MIAIHKFLNVLVQVSPKLFCKGPGSKCFVLCTVCCTHLTLVAYFEYSYRPHATSESTAFIL
jgi:hypothetical protein